MEEIDVDKFHKCIFENDKKKLSLLLNQNRNRADLIGQKDKHGKIE